MDNNIIGQYYVRLKDVHIKWIHRTGPKRGNEAYVPIPAKYAYGFEIKNGDIYTCNYIGSDQVVQLKAAGTQSRRSYAKQFQGLENLKILYDWYESHGATEGDYVIVSIYTNHRLTLEFVSQTQTQKIEQLRLYGANGKLEVLSEQLYPNSCGFRLLSLLVKDKESVICNYNFLSDSIKAPSSEPITTLIIGANGTGKSMSMKILSEIFLAVQNNSTGKLLPYEYYSLKYLLDNAQIEIEIINKTIIIHKNGILCEKADMSLLPQKVLAIAFMLNDKFAFKAGKGDEQSVYEYLGMRVTSNAAWTSSFENRVAENLIELAAEGKLDNLIDQLPSYLQVDPKISISCELSDGENFLSKINNMSLDELVDYLKEVGERVIKSDSFRGDTVKKWNDQDYLRLSCFLHGLIELDPFVSNSQKQIFGFTFNANDDRENVQKIQADYKTLRDLNSLRIIKNITLFLYKNGYRYSFDESSSGEKHILYAFLSIARYIKNNSLILIDEPEISLHPNWQMLYISFLKRLFKEQMSCHFILASHSPYLVSDLNPVSSSLIVLKTEEGIRSAETLDYSTYAWSTENILYNVFRVRTTRNFYFDMDLRELLHKTDCNNRDNVQFLRVKQLYEKLSSYVFDEHDPLRLILNEVKGYIDNVESE